MLPGLGLRVVLGLAVSALVLGFTPAEAARKPTRPEREMLERALSRVEVVPYPMRIRAATISTVSSEWAAVECSSDCQDPANWIFLFHRDRSAWRRVGFFELVDKPVGFCAYAPAAVIHDLFRIACPGRRALHARAASEVEKNELAAALQRRYGTQASSHMTIARPCVSRLDPNWASATIAATGNVDSANIWFQRKTGRWAVAYSPPYAKRGRPSDAIILSLASCVGYSASV